ncbi:hypothetical protein CDV55_102572 [Aspergillus turcosus]|nr:hypothetical protein CDV55_102572 [Aspergillus turcosus]
MLNLSVFDLLVPLLVILTAVLYLPITLIALVKNQRTADLASWKSFQQAWFSRFWHFFGWATRPLFARDVEKVLSNAHGVVVDVGSGSGDWLYLFAEARNSDITKLYLVEPNADFHPALRKKIKELGLEGKCQIVRWVEDLGKVGVEAGTVDTISTVHVLCSVQSPGPLVKTLYQYLKPNGQWLVYEHVKARNGRSVAGVCQAGINTVWPIFLDGCSLTRDTEDLLLHSGKWTSTDLRPGTNEGWFNQLPHIVGVLVK